MTFKEQFCEELEDAREAGWKTGITEGERNAKVKTARLMIANNMPASDIAKYTGLTEDEVRVLQKA